MADEETESFFRAIRQTKEYKAMKERVDSANNAAGENEVPQEIKIKATKRGDQTDEDLLFLNASMDRQLGIGIALEQYFFKFDRRKKQIVSATHSQTNYSIK